jgi:predicted nuclease with TOPRIM domain
MSEDKIPEWDRAKREILSQLRGLWEEIGKLTDWSWRLEQRIDHVEERLTMIEKQHMNLRRDFDRSDAKPVRTGGRWETF